ncbi:MAG: L28 family ribosomal protein [Minisyncoccia bacterium]
MSRVCQVCGRGTRSSQSRSHSNIATKRKQYINIQKRKADGKTIKMCTSCIKTTAKNKTE